MAFLEFYVDESGHSSTHKFITVAGFLGPAEQWLGFADEWNAALLDAGVVGRGGRVGVFSMGDCEAFQGLFRGWTEERRRALLGTLLPIITRRSLHSIGSVVSIDWWQSFNWATSPFAAIQPISDPYHVALQNLLSLAVDLSVALNEMSDDAARYPELANPEGVACVIAQQGEFGKQASIYAGALAHLAKSHIRDVTVTFSAMRDFPQLQAADLLAFELRWRFTRPDIPIRWPMQQIMNARRFFCLAAPLGLNATAMPLQGKIRDYPMRVIGSPAKGTERLNQKSSKKRQRKRQK